MWWEMGIGALTGILGAQGAQGINAANNRIAKSNNMLAKNKADASNKVRQASNLNVAAQSSLASWVQSVNNSRRLDEGGRLLEENSINFYRQADKMAGQSLAQEITNSEQAGVMAVSAAAAGVDGQVVDMVNSSTALRNAIVGEEADRMRGAVSYDTARRAGLIMSQTISSLDNSLLIGNLDYNVDVAARQADNLSAPSLLSGAFSGVMKALPAALGSLGSAAPTSGAASSAFALPTTGVKFGFTTPMDTSTFSLGSAKFGATESFTGSGSTLYSITSR